MSLVWGSSWARDQTLHSSDQSHNGDNARSLTRCATKGTPDQNSYNPNLSGQDQCLDTAKGFFFLLILICVCLVPFQKEFEMADSKYSFQRQQIFIEHRLYMCQAEKTVVWETVACPQGTYNTKHMGLNNKRKIES